MGYKNTSARMITIETESGESLTLVPGESGAIKGKLGNAQNFVDDLIGRDELIEVDVKEAKTETKAEKKARDDLKKQLTELGATFDEDASKEELQAQVDAELAK